MQTLNDVHWQFAEFFHDHSITPIAYLLSKKLSEGHICLDAGDEAEMLENPESLMPMPSLNLRVEHPLIGRIDDLQKPFIRHNERVYIQRYFNYETAILYKIRELIELESQTFEQRKVQLEGQRDFIKQLFSDSSSIKGLSETERIDWQLMAALLGILNRFTIITGGPGTGKTTTVAKILAVLYTIEPETKVVLAAPTGKAAFRMAESLKNAKIDVSQSVKERFQTLVPSTIHRLLKPLGLTPHFRHNANNPLKADVVIIDEASMVDVTLFAKLLSAIGADTRVILLGDKDQLASVDAGSVLGDLCQTQEKMNVVSTDKALWINGFIGDDSRRLSSGFMAETSSHLLNEHIVELKRSHRFSGEKGIGRLSRAVIHNDREALAVIVEHCHDDAVEIDTTYSDHLFDSFVDNYQGYIAEADIRKALVKLNDQRVLCAIREGEQGVYQVNQRIETLLRQKGLLTGRGEFYENRPVMVTQNNPTLGLFNGDVGIVRTNKEGRVKVWFEDAKGDLKGFNPGYLGSVETVYAMTIHKSQGSEFNRVLVLLPNQPDLPLLTRELVYTAITRAKSKAIVQSSVEVLMNASSRQVKRASGLMHRFEEMV